jgi:hypothetical protein
VSTDTRPSPEARRDAAIIKSQRTLDLRMAGATFASIATALGYSDRGAARKAYLRALDAEVNLKADERDAWRREQAARCDRLIRALWPQAMNGDTKAHGAITRHLERQARLLGLDAPTRVQVDDGLTAEIEGLLAEMGRLEREQAVADLKALDPT